MKLLCMSISLVLRYFLTPVPSVLIHFSEIPSIYISSQYERPSSTPTGKEIDNIIILCKLIFIGFWISKGEVKHFKVNRSKNLPF
jgi:hypothetical protein